MHPDWRKIWVVATTEFGSFIRTKAFIIGILLLPVITGGSVLLQLFIAKRVDSTARSVAVLDRTGVLYPALARAAAGYNAQAKDAQGKPVHPTIKVESIESSSQGNAEPSGVLELSNRVRRGELDAFIDIPPEVIDVPKANDRPTPGVRYHSDNPNDEVIRGWLAAAVNGEVRSRRFRAAGIDQAATDRLIQPVDIDNLGLAELDRYDESGRPTIKDAQKVDRIRTMLVPAVLMFSMFFVIITSAPQLLNSVIEEKMSKISEVLLGSVNPFELMMGKLLGNAGIAVVLAALYLSAGYAVAAYYGYTDLLSGWLLLALGLFLIEAILLYGSLYMAVGAACNELKDAQSLMMPVMLLTMFPTFVWLAILQNPSSNLSVGLSLFPPASPFLMMMRLAMRPAPPLWQVVLSIILTSLTAVLCVWAAGKIFRIGLLMQGKTPSFRDLARWVAAS